MSLISKLCKANRRILEQKVDLLNALSTRHGTENCSGVYSTPCSIVKASIGQHFRHSLDHIECVTSVSEDPETKWQMHYDLRTRSSPDEQCPQRAKMRITRLDKSMAALANADLSQNHPVYANFMLSGDSAEEFSMESTIARELAFCAHHAIHHMAMIKLIALNPEVGDLLDSQLPPDFGRAPSTVNNDKAEE